MPDLDEELVSIGRITSPYGIKGWVKILTQTEPAENIFQYQPWSIRTKKGIEHLEVTSWRAQGKAYVAQIKQISDRNQAEALCPVDLLIEKSIFPELGEGDYYWHELEACEVVSVYEGQSLNLGYVDSLMSTGANDVLVVKPSNGSVDDRERLIPYIFDQYICSVDIKAKLITVDWDAHF